MNTPAPKYNPFADLQPEPAEPQGARGQLAALGRAAESLAFARPAPPEVAIKRQRGGEGTVHQFTMRCRVRDSNRFVMWCESERLSYREGFTRLVALLDQGATEEGGA